MGHYLFFVLSVDTYLVVTKIIIMYYWWSKSY